MNRSLKSIITRERYGTCTACRREHVYTGPRPLARITVGEVTYLACPAGVRALEGAFGREGRADTSFQLRLPGLAPVPRFQREEP